MNLTKINERIWISDFDDDRDRPTLALIIGDKFNLGIDVGHSKAHVEEYYDALKKENLPLPDISILTHWHWDHSFGIHAMNGLAIAERRSLKHIKDIKNDKDYIEHLLKTNPHFDLEFKNQEIIIEEPHIIFDEKIEFDLGNLKAQAFHVISSHSDDCILIYIPEYKILFFGDAISGIYPSWEIDVDKHIAFTNIIRDIDFDIAIGSHWLPYNKEDLLSDLVNMRKL